MDTTLFRPVPAPVLLQGPATEAVTGDDGGRHELEKLVPTVHS